MIDPYDIPEDDVNTFDMLCKGKTLGVFQLESPLLSHWSKKFQPRSISDLAILVAAVRPGVLNTKALDGRNMTQIICDRKNGLEDVKYDYPILERALKDTWGVLLMQEQLLIICEDVAGWDRIKGLDLMKSVAKKDMAKLLSLKQKFIDDSVKYGKADETVAKAIFESMEASGRYLFNACISGNTKLFLSSFGQKKQYRWTVEEAYKIRNDIEYAKSTGHISLYKKWKRLGHYGKGWSLCSDGRIRPNEILEIRVNGQKEVFRVTLEDDSYIEVTNNHKFPTPNGEKELSDLKIGDSLYKRGDYEKGNGKKYTLSNISREEISKRSKGQVNGAFGSENWGYTNGGWADFVKNSALLPMECKHCKVTECNRFEIDHVNGDRSNNAIENLQRLCVSCHKKKEYTSGRIRRGEKGYPSYLVPIKSIKSIGLQETYDVTMGNPNHNFITESNIITSNSHSYSYGYLAYVTAYWKANRFLNTFVARLRQSGSAIDPHEEVAKLVTECQSENVEVNLPTILDIRKTFYKKDGAIYFDIGNVKGVGESHVESIIETIQEGGRPTTWMGWLIAYGHKIPKDKTHTYPKISASIFKSLIEVGAFDFLGEPRRKMVFELENFQLLSPGEQKWMRANYVNESLIDLLKKGAKTKKEGGAAQKEDRITAINSIIDMLKNPPFELRDTIDYVLTKERESLGISLTYSKIDKFDTSLANATLKQFSEGNGIPNPAMFACEIVQVRRTNIKKQGKNFGREMALLTLRDETMTFNECVIFPDDWDKYGELFHEGSVLVVEAEADRFGKSLIVKRAARMERTANIT